MPKGQFRRFATLDQYPMLKRSGDHCICGVNTYYIVDWTCILLPFMLCSFSKTTLQTPEHHWSFRIYITYLCSKYFSLIVFKKLTDFLKVTIMQC